MGAHNFDVVEPRTLADQVLERLREAIISGQLPAGERLNEADIAQQMSISRAPLREALGQLEQEGLIISVPHRGSFVREFSEEDIRETFQLRSALEALACEVVVAENKLRTVDLDFLSQLVEKQEALIGAAKLVEAAELDMDFHEFICEKTEYPRLMNTWQSLRHQSQMLIRQSWDVPPEVMLQHGVRFGTERHRDIVAALRRGDALTASQRCRQSGQGIARAIQGDHRKGG